MRLCLFLLEFKIIPVYLSLAICANSPYLFGYRETV